MILGRSIIGVITARGGSKGLPGKNLAPLGGRPLIAWTIKAGQSASSLDRLIVSTEDETIAEVAQALGCEVPFRRETHLARDETPSIDVLIHALEQCPGYDYVVLLQPTSPLRTAEDVDTAIRFCIECSAPACVSVSRAKKSPQWMFTMDEKAHLSPATSSYSIPNRRQDLQSVYVLNGAIYVADIDWLRTERTFFGPQTVAYEMPVDRSLDIDTEHDLRVAEVYLA